MDDQFYRKPPPTLGARMRKTLKKKSVVLTLLVGGIALGFVTFSNRGIIQRLSLESQKREMQEKLQQAQKEQRHLQEQSKALDSDPKAIEKVAREKYGMIREGETVYKVKKEK